MSTRILLQDGQPNRWLSFGAARHLYSINQHRDVLPVLADLERAVERGGLWAVGFIAYEAASAFDPILQHRASNTLPLLWMGLFDAPTVLDHLPLAVASEIPRYAWEPTQSQDDYDAAIARIRAWIAAGDTYQVNHTLRLRSAAQESAEALFGRMVNANSPCYSAFIDTGAFAICSASPELFFRLDQSSIITRPMKGTTGRGLWQADDERKAQALRASPKDRAENVMIVDMMRNDLGRIAHMGSVKTPTLFEIERYPTLWQMTSTVEAQTQAGFTEILRAVFPAASITGAPKARAMQIIAELENTPRGVYTGCIGYLAPGRRAQFNVAIRTAVIDRASNTVEYGVGGGIVWDSTSSAEYAECLLKARIVIDAPPPFELLETLLWEPGSGYFLLEEHLQRLAESAHYLDVSLDMSMLRTTLQSSIPTTSSRPQRVRLTVDRDGRQRVEWRDAPTPSDEPVTLGIAPSPIKRNNPFLYHKTTHRALYDAARAACPTCDDVVLWNEEGEVTETAIANIIIERDGRWVTPTMQCGLLPGVFRGALLQSGAISEGRVTLDELRTAGKIFLINSVRKWRPARIR